MRSVLESHGRLFDPDAFANGDGQQRTYCDMELARLYGPLDECYRSRVSALLENADDEQLGTAERLQATGLLLCIYREYRALDSARYLVGARQAEVLADFFRARN